MQKPLHLLTPEERAALVESLRQDALLEDGFTGVLGNKNSFFIARPASRRKPAKRKVAKATA